MATRTAEQYLKLILTLEGLETGLMTELARLTGVTPASVTGMVKRLAAQGLLLHVSYGGVELTSAGREIAVRLLRRHRIAESYLHEKLEYPLHLLHDEADALEHHMSAYLEERMNSVLGAPAFDPHGHPIPDAEGRLPEFRGLPLAEAAIGFEGVVAVVPDRDPLFLRRLVDIDCVPGSPLRLMARDEETGVVRVGLGRAEHDLNPSHAKDIFVCAEGDPENTCFEDFLSNITTAMR
jgi:DtxR family Mn-dependent transcriptional regulator